MSGQHALREAVRAGDWCTISFEALSDRLNDGGNAQVQTIEGSDHVVRMNGLPAARLAVVNPVDARAIITVGGFVTKKNVPGFAGVLIGHMPNLSRTSGEPRMNAEAFRSWLKHAEPALALVLSKYPDVMRIAWYGNLYLEFEIRPTKLRCFLSRKAMLNCDELAQTKLSKTVLIILQNKFRWTDPDGVERDVNIDEAIGSKNLQLNAGAILAPINEPGLHAKDREGWPEWYGETLPTFHVIAGQPFPWTLPLLAIEAVARSWDLDPQVLVHPLLKRGPHDLFPEFDSPIGTYYKATARATVLKLHRPSKSTRTRR